MQGWYQREDGTPVSFQELKPGDVFHLCRPKPTDKYRNIQATYTVISNPYQKNTPLRDGTLRTDWYIKVEQELME